MIDLNTQSSVRTQELSLTSWHYITFWVSWTLYFVLLKFDLLSSFVHTFLCHLVVVKVHYSVKICVKMRWRATFSLFMLNNVCSLIQIWLILEKTSYDTANQDVWGHWDFIFKCAPNKCLGLKRLMAVLRWKGCCETVFPNIYTVTSNVHHSNRVAIIDVINPNLKKVSENR